MNIVCFGEVHISKTRMLGSHLYRQYPSLHFSYNCRQQETQRGRNFRMSKWWKIIWQRNFFENCNNRVQTPRRRKENGSETILVSTAIHFPWKSLYRSRLLDYIFVLAWLNGLGSVEVDITTQLAGLACFFSFERIVRGLRKRIVAYLFGFESWLNEQISSTSWNICQSSIRTIW